jgi:hypothetical protein
LESNPESFRVVRPDTFSLWRVYSNQKLTRQRSYRKADLVVGVEQDTAVRDRPKLQSNFSQVRALCRDTRRREKKTGHL